jgi:putative iron-dependent peroxidase
VEWHPFAEVVGSRHTAVSTPGDLLLHIRAHRFDLCFELARRLTERFAGYAGVVDEVHGFRSFDLRDMLGFVDGTENPSGQRAEAAVDIGDEDPDFAGGSYVLVQKYLHNLRTWDALAVENQERVIGRYKLDDIEMSDEAKPSDSHVALNTIVDDDGVQHQIVRFNMPFGRVGAGEYGTYFIGYARSPAVLEQMIENMFVGGPPGNYDRILDYSTAVTAACSSSRRSTSSKGRRRRSAPSRTSRQPIGPMVPVRWAPAPAWSALMNHLLRPLAPSCSRTGRRSVRNGARS